VERFVVREVAEVVADHGEAPPAALSGREESSSGHHAARHLLHPPLLAALVLEPDLKQGAQCYDHPFRRFLPVLAKNWRFSRKQWMVMIYSCIN
jgi:hypothetical protein